MSFSEYQIINTYKDGEDTLILQTKPINDNTSFSFLPGQYAFIKNPHSQIPSEAHPFSIASSPTNKDYLEFCIKKLGDWTTEFVDTAKKGDTLLISSPTGSFVWSSNIDHAVFLLGGIGISPIMSMVRYIEAEKHMSKITMLYGNRTPETVVYRKELTKIQKSISLNIVDIYSNIADTHPWKGHRGFITEEIVKKEVNLKENPTFFVIGPPIFIEKMETLLHNLLIPPEHILQEKLEKRD